ncbi:hypothetical protein HN51_049282 [Arachis hypogaea]|uniref:Transmembrane protein n=1 Tax=Arachis hypogaea TaxID=3818 RepID=A0A444YFF7_ARAHY|nr:uncharacterized protein LOC107608121 [Arachis ipaensis]XP_025668827.1 uncharacterized protein LOC112767162 [Arachis hypogaea]RYR00683.1 hypothetical protein Ahy_B07g088817 [Arachis hypogaea]
MEKVSIQQIFCKLCPLLPFVLVLVLFSLLYFFSVFESFPHSLFTTLVALFTTLFLVTLTRTKWSIDEKNLVQDNNLKKLESSLPSLLGDVTKESEINADEKYEEQHADQDSESQSTSSFENDQERSENYGMISNSDVDDVDEEEEEEEEDSLIEIKLPNRYLVEEPKQKFESNLTELFLPEYMFKQKGLMDLLEEINEINEDENLIEIDISMGSTKCQDFRLKKELAYYGADQCVLSD